MTTRWGEGNTLSRNIRNAAILVLVVAVAALVVAVAALGWMLSDKSRRDNVEFTENCASQATKLFARLGYSESGPTGSTFAHYQSHFNPRLNKCFMLLEVTTRGGGTMFYDNVLLDAYEQREYAEYQGDPFKSLPMGCQLMPLSGDERHCASRHEYDAFVAEYMK